MGLDWNPANKPIPGREEEFAELRAALEAAPEDDESGAKEEAAERFFAASISAFDTLGAPTIGIDKSADDWAMDFHRENNVEEPFEIWFEKVRGLKLVHLVPCSGVPRYSNGSPGGYVEPFSFRAQFLTFCEDIIGSELLESCYENKSPDELIALGVKLKTLGENYAREFGVNIPPESAEFDENLPEWKADILIAAGEWCIYWGERNHPLEAYW